MVKQLSHLKNKTFFFIVALLLLLLLAWFIISHWTSSNQNKRIYKVVTVTQVPSTKTLYFSGLIKPLSIIPITSPVEGIIEKQHFNFGNYVKKGQLLFTLASRTEHSTLQTALSSYLTAKHNLNKDKLLLEQTEMLYNQGLESKNSYQTVKDSYFTDQLALLQAETQLKTLKYLSFDQIEQLSGNNVEEISKFLGTRNAADDIPINSPSDGIALFVKNSESANPSESDIPSNRVKDGDVLTAIGDTSNLVVNIKIDELNLSQIHPGQKALITCSAAKDTTLPGYVSDVNTQASNDSENGIPIFSAKVVIPSLTSEQRHTVHIGMSAKVAIEILHNPQIMIPTNAIFRINDQTFVKVINPKNKKVVFRVVITGDTKLLSVAILSGLSEGEKILVPTQS